MIIADKIMENRKKNGWSQEELAEKLGVSRQSVSKWESAQSVPDMKKILQLSEIFAVSTDYLLRDEIEEADTSSQPVYDLDEEDAVKSVSMEEANAFLKYNEKAASVISTGVMLCILSPVIMLLMGALAQVGKISMSVASAEIGGTVILLSMVTVAVAMFVMTGLNGKQFGYLSSSNIDTAYGVSGMVKEKRADYSPKHNRLLVIGIMLCVASAIPLLMTTMTEQSGGSELTVMLGVIALLIMVAAGVKMIVLTCIRQGGYDKLLEEGDYTRMNKRISRYEGIYWAIALAIYLAWSFITNRWELTWIVWPVAGVLFAVYREIIKAVIRSKSR